MTEPRPYQAGDQQAPQGCNPPLETLMGKVSDLADLLRRPGADGKAQSDGFFKGKIVEDLLPKINVLIRTLLVQNYQLTMWVGDIHKRLAEVEEGGDIFPPELAEKMADTLEEALEYLKKDSGAEATAICASIEEVLEEADEFLGDDEEEPDAPPAGAS